VIFFKLKFRLLFVIYLLIECSAVAQDTSISFFAPDTSFNKKRFTYVVATEASLYGSSLIGLNTLWFKNYQQSSFHFFNDNKEWLQMDKAGHAFSCYNVGLAGIELYRWSGVSNKKAIWYGGSIGLAYMITIETMDGLSSGWGFSWGDITANTAGLLLDVGQELAWKKQRVTLKYSFRQSPYAQYRPSQLGNNVVEQLIKDYNGQIEWCSVNIASFIKKENKFPKWLNVALGYGGNGMIGGFINPVVYDRSGNQIFFERYRQFYLSLDMDLRNIKTKSHFVNTLFKTFGFIKFPAPSLEFNKHGTKGHWLGF